MPRWRQSYCCSVDVRISASGTKRKHRRIYRKSQARFPIIQSPAPGWAICPDIHQDTALDKIDEIKGHAGNRPPWSAAAVQGYPIKFLPTVKDPRSAREGLDRHPIPASFKPGSHSLADLVADRDWRKQTSEMLKRLFR